MEPPFLRWRVQGEYVLRETAPGLLNPKRCFIKVNLDQNQVRVLDGSELNKGQLFGQIIAETVYDFRFTEKFCFHISQYAISEDEFNYWNNIKIIFDSHIHV
mgnify:CR=1 FL=1